mmetsp:Transcript_25552/g.74559  ORF Transcript_25552/g.74559 Transcript_25552/m.74559 type:complete len:81 (+) Transcript_25552:732-974(+)
MWSRVGPPFGKPCLSYSRYFLRDDSLEVENDLVKTGRGGGDAVDGRWEAVLVAEEASAWPVILMVPPERRSGTKSPLHVR